MADEVAEKYPDAVCRHADGYLRWITAGFLAGVDCPTFPHWPQPATIPRTYSRERPMTDRKPEPAKESRQRTHAKARYRAPKLEILGSLRSATRGTGGGNADGAAGMDGGNIGMMI